MDKQSWLEVSLVVDGELAEAVAEVLSRFAPNGVVIESTAIHSKANTFGEAYGPLRVTAYVPAEGDINEVKQAIEQSLHYLSIIQTLPPASYKIIEDENWMQAWKAHFKPVIIGKKLVILPPWANNPSSDRIPILIDPGMAFGTGTHPTTQLCLLMLERRLNPGDLVLDVGSGSGILSIAALKLGATKAIGVDVEKGAKQIAYDNARLNNQTENIVFETGSIESLLDGSLGAKEAPVVVANILTHILIQLLQSGMTQLVSPGGVLVLSGILEEAEADLVKELATHQFKIVDRVLMGDWVGLSAQKE